MLSWWLQDISTPCFTIPGFSNVNSSTTNFSTLIIPYCIWLTKSNIPCNLLDKKVLGLKLRIEKSGAEKSSYSRVRTFRVILTPDFLTRRFNIVLLKPRRLKSSWLKNSLLKSLGVVLISQTTIKEVESWVEKYRVEISCNHKQCPL